MLPTIVAASVLAAVTALVHAVGLGALINFLLPEVAQLPMDYWRSTRLLVGVVWALLLIHAIEIALWAMFYLAAGCLPDAESALDGRIVGNASLIPFRDHGKRVYRIANVATHPDYRRRGIGRALTERAMLQARAKNAISIWLHVRDDNPGAIELYQGLGFQEVARRTAWYAGSDRQLPGTQSGIEIVPRHPRFWPLQLKWLHKLNPDSLSWYHSWNLNAFRPGFWNWVYLLFVDSQVRQWAAVRGDELLGTLTWLPQSGRSESLYAAIGEGADGEVLTRLLVHAQRSLSHYSALSLDFPAGEMTEAIRAAGFSPRRTLLWMRA